MSRKIEEKVSTNYKTTVIAISVHGENDNPMFGESATHVKIEDEAAGPFIVLSQAGHETAKTGEVQLDFEELNRIVAAAKRLERGWPVENE